MWGLADAEILQVAEKCPSPAQKRAELLPGSVAVVLCEWWRRPGTVSTSVSSPAGGSAEAKRYWQKDTWTVVGTHQKAASPKLSGSYQPAA